MKTVEDCTHPGWRLLYRDVLDYEHRAAAAVAFAECASCGLVRQEPPPPPESLAAPYPSDYRAHVGDGASLLPRAVSALKGIQAELLVTSLRPLLPGTGAAILEVGCGAGHLLRRLRARGFRRLHGVDRAPALGPALERSGIAFTACDVDDAGALAGALGSERFHTIVMINVIEHLAHPGQVLAACAGLLEPGGQVLLVTPNTASLSHRVFRRFWSGLHAPRHVELHRPSTLGAAARAAGFATATVSFPVDPASWALSAQNLLESRRARAPRYGTRPYALALLPVVAPLALAESALGRGSSMLVRLVRPLARAGADRSEPVSP